MESPASPKIEKRTTDEPPPLPGPAWHKFHRGYDAANRGDLGVVLEFLHPGIEWDVSPAFADSPVYRGHEGVRRFFADAEKLWDEFRLEIEELHRAREHFVVLGWWSGRGKASRVPVRSHGAWVYRMHRGRAIRMRFYLDREAALRSVGLALSEKNLRWVHVAKPAHVRQA